MKAILVGAGGITRELMRRLGEVWEVTAIDTSAERLDLASETRTLERVVGDGSSRVVLRRADLQGADALVAASDDDETNLEVCRIALEAGLSRIAAVAVDHERLADYRELGVEAVSPEGLAARRLEVALETRRVSSTSIADGKAEVLEFRIANDSPVRGKALKDLRAHSWIVAALLRGNQVIIPHGETRLETNDVVTVVGAGADFAEIVKTFTSGEGRFPLDFGKRVAVGLRTTIDLEHAFAEAVVLARNSRASSLVVLHPDPETVRDETLQTRIRDLLDEARRRAEGVEMRLRPLDGQPGKALGGLPAEESVGVLVVPAPPQRGLRAWKAIRGAVGLVRSTRRPVLVSRGSAPYRRIVVPARRTPAGRAALRAGIDLAMFNQADLVGVAVVDPVFISGDEAPTEAREAIAWLEEEAAVHGVRVEGLIRRGNPVRTLATIARDADLVVLGVRGAARPVLRPEMEAMIARRTSRSVLLVPVQEQD